MLLLPLEPKNDRLEFSPPHRNVYTTKEEVAELRDEEIGDLSFEQLISVIRAAQLPFLNRRFEDRLELLEREILVRLVHLARHCCRNQQF